MPPQKHEDETQHDERHETKNIEGNTPATHADTHIHTYIQGHTTSYMTCSCPCESSFCFPLTFLSSFVPFFCSCFLFLCFFVSFFFLGLSQQFANIWLVSSLQFSRTSSSLSSCSHFRLVPFLFWESQGRAKELPCTNTFESSTSCGPPLQPPGTSLARQLRKCLARECLPA